MKEKELTKSDKRICENIVFSVHSNEKEKDYNEIIRKVPEQLIRRKHYAGEKFKFIAGKQIWLLSADVFSGGYGTDDLSDDFYDRLYQNPGRDRGNDTSGSACD